MKTAVIGALVLLALAFGLMLIKRFFVPSEQKLIRMTSLATNPETGIEERINYTPYFEHIFIDKKTRHRVRIYATFGKERVAPGQSMADYKDFVDRVLEAYFMNDSDSEMTFELIRLAYSESNTLIPNVELNLPIVVGPKSEALTPTFHDICIPFAREFDFELIYKLNGQTFTMRDTLKRVIAN